METDTDTSATSARRLIVYALASEGTEPGRAVERALSGLRPHAGRIVVVAASSVDMSDLDRLNGLVDASISVSAEHFSPDFYRLALARERLADWDEVLLTGDGWFGPMVDFDEVFDRMSRVEASHWQMIEDRHGPLREFPDQGFPRQSLPWTWTLLRRAAFESAAWEQYWREPGSSTGEDLVFTERLSEAGLRGAHAYTADAFGTDHPAVFSADLLLDAGCPILSRTLFGLYPPLLQQHAVLGRDVLRAAEIHGFPLEAVWPTLSRTVPAKALNTNAGMLEVLPRSSSPEPGPHRIAVIAYISDVTLAPELRDRLAHLPDGYDLIITTNDGVKARHLRGLWSDGSSDHGVRRLDVRVTPANPGRDMSDFFVACRDVILSDDYDLVVKVHARRKRSKTMNVRRYFRRYQWDNILGGSEHIRAIIALFEREPGLGMVFPPMLHIGYSTMGRGWGPYRKAALAVLAQLSVRVPQDLVSPLAPYGGMWVARPAALRALASQGWTYRDFRGPRESDLARVLERIVVPVAARDGFHARTVLSREHAAISHTALEFKADEMLAAAPGYPVDQITLLHRAGPTGRGGIVGLTRMYLRLNHRVLSRLLLPPMAAAEHVFHRTSRARHAARDILGRRGRPKIKKG